MPDKGGIDAKLVQARWHEFGRTIMDAIEAAQVGAAHAHVVGKAHAFSGGDRVELPGGHAVLHGAFPTLPPGLQVRFHGNPPSDWPAQKEPVQAEGRRGRELAQHPGRTSFAAFRSSPRAMQRNLPSYRVMRAGLTPVAGMTRSMNSAWARTRSSVGRSKRRSVTAFLRCSRMVEETDRTSLT